MFCFVGLTKHGCLQEWFKCTCGFCCVGHIGHHPHNSFMCRVLFALSPGNNERENKWWRHGYDHLYVSSLSSSHVHCVILTLTTYPHFISSPLYLSKVVCNPSLACFILFWSVDLLTPTLFLLSPNSFFIC